jgi:hypothetical protein
MQDREELNKRMVTVDKLFDKMPNHAVSSRYLFKALRRDRRFQEDMRLIIKAGGDTYRGKKILGGDDPYIWRFTRAEIKAELKGELGGQLGVCHKPEVFEPHDYEPDDFYDESPEEEAEAALEANQMKHVVSETTEQDEGTIHGPVVTHSITPALTPLTVAPAPIVNEPLGILTGDPAQREKLVELARAERQDANEILLNAAYAAAITAANAVNETDINARFHPVLVFYTNRQTIKFGRMLKAKGVESYSHRGRTCYGLSSMGYLCVGAHERKDISTPAYRTYEEAWAYAKGFAEALPNLDIAYGVTFKGDERIWEDGTNGCYATLIMRNEPAQTHGG